MFPAVDIIELMWPAVDIIELMWPAVDIHRCIESIIISKQEMAFCETVPNNVLS